LVEPGQGPPAQADNTLVGIDEPAGEHRQRTLARPRPADDSDRHAIRHSQVQVAQNRATEPANGDPDQL
jgi:hypothetical protein